MSVKMIVAFHKPYRVPEKSCYLPMHVGASGKQSLGPAWTRDDTGDNISDKNASFCELTGIYWAWKHISADIIGTAHYRRYFVNQKWWNKPFNRILDEQQIEAMLQGHDAILPKKRHYYIETRESQYCHAHHPEDLACVRQVLTEKYPDYLPQWDEMLKTRSGHIFNMFIMRQPLFDAYMTWLMDILFTVEEQLDTSSYSASDLRVYGYLAERLLDVWVNHHHIRYVECPVKNLENQHWFKKIFNFLKRKFTKKGPQK